MERSLSRTQAEYGFNHADVISGIGDDAALVKANYSGAGDSPLHVHTIDYLKVFLCDPFLMGQIAAVHAMSGDEPPSSESEP